MPSNGVGGVFHQGLYSVSATQKHSLGARRVLADGREFVYCQSGNGDLDTFGGTDIPAGILLQTAAANTIFEDMAIATIALGATSIAVTPGAGTAVRDLYAGGFAVVTDSTAASGEGFTYVIDSHAAVSISTAFTLNLADAVREAIAADGTLTMVPHPCKAVIGSPVTTPTGQPIGVSPVDVDVSVAPFHWVQVKGPIGTLIAGTLVVGEGVTFGAAVAGSVAPYNEDGTANYPVIGFAMLGVTDTEYGLVYLNTGF